MSDRAFQHGLTTVTILVFAWVIWSISSTATTEIEAVTEHISLSVYFRGISLRIYYNFLPTIIGGIISIVTWGAVVWGIVGWLLSANRGTWVNRLLIGIAAAIVYVTAISLILTTWPWIILTGVAGATLGGVLGKRAHYAVSKTILAIIVGLLIGLPLSFAIWFLLMASISGVLNFGTIIAMVLTGALFELIAAVLLLQSWGRSHLESPATAS